MAIDNEMILQVNKIKIIDINEIYRVTCDTAPLDWSGIDVYSLAVCHRLSVWVCCVSFNFVPQQRILLTFPFGYKSKSASNDVVTFPRKQQ